MSWTDEKVAKLKELWGKGNTASQIAEILGGVSRNAVIGKAHRLNLSGKIIIQIFPTFLTLREIEILVAYICLAVPHPGSKAFIP